MEASNRRSGRISIADEDLQHHDALLPEAGIDIEQVDEAFEQQSGARHQNQRQRHFDGDEAEPQTPLSGVGGHGSQARLLEAQARESERGNQPREDGDAEGEQRRKQQRRSVDVQAVEPHHVGRPPAGEAPHRDVRQHDPRQRCHRRKHQRLGQQLRDDTPAIRAERRPDGKLVLPSRASCQQKIGDVDTGDQQHGKDGGCEERDGGTHIADQMFAKGNDGRSRVLVRAWVVDFDLGRDGVHFRPGRFDGHSVPQPSYHLPVAGGAALRFVADRESCRPQADAARHILQHARLKVVGCDADHHVRGGIERDGFSDYAGVGAKVAAP